MGYPYVFLDATYCKARVGHGVVSQAVVVAFGVAADGRREVLGFDVGDSENEGFWTAFLRSLKARGLDGVQLVISDAHSGLKKAIGTVFQARRGSVAGCISCATCSRPCRRDPRTWSPRSSVLPSPSPMPGVDATLHNVPEMQHSFVFRAGRVPEVNQAIQAMGQWLRSKLGHPAPAKP